MNVPAILLFYLVANALSSGILSVALFGTAVFNEDLLKLSRSTRLVIGAALAAYSLVTGFLILALF